jgi:hypothetical protein
MSTVLGPNGEKLIAEVTAPAPFGDQDRAILELERLRFLTPGSKHDEILARFAMTPVRYYIRLNWILNQPEAAAYDPDLIGHLTALRDKRRDVRTRGTVAAGVTTRPDTRGVRPALLEVTR